MWLPGRTVAPAELKPEELPSYDKQAIFNWANQPAGSFSLLLPTKRDVESPLLLVTYHQWPSELFLA